MGTDNRRIDKERVCQRTGIRLETLPELTPEPASFPAAKAVIDRVPVSKRLWQVTPGRPSAGKVKYGFDEQPIAEHRGTPSTRFDRSKDGGNLRPCLISQQQTYRHQVSSRRHRIHGREKTYPGIMNSSTRPRQRHVVDVNDSTSRAQTLHVETYPLVAVSLLLSIPCATF